jgi:hypothetical protein
MLVTTPSRLTYKCAAIFEIPLSLKLNRGLVVDFDLYSVIRKDGLNFVRLYFLNYTWYVNDLLLCSTSFACAA